MKTPGLFLLLIFQTAFFAQDKKSDSLKMLLHEVRQDTDKIRIWNQLADLAWKKGNYDEAMSYVVQSKPLAEAAGDKKGLAKALHIMGLSYMYKSDYEEAQKYNFWSLKLKKELGNKADMSASYNSIGNVYQYQGNYPAALKNHLEALHLREEIGDKPTIASSYNNIGNVYYSQGSLDKALENYEKALQIKKRIGNRSTLASPYNNIGLIYFEKENYDVALSYYMTALSINTETNDRNGLGISYHNIARVKSAKGLYKESLEYNLKALKIMEEIGDQYGTARDYAGVSAAYKGLGKLDECIKYSLKALALAKETGALDFIFEANNTLSEVYSEKGDYKNALVHYKAYIAARDSLINEENTKKTVRLEMNYEFEKKEAATRLEQEKRDAIAAAESKRQRIILYAISGLGLFVLGFAVFAYRSFLQKQRANIEITRQKHVIEEKQKEILDSIHYAKRIQTGLLPREKYIDRNIKRLKVTGA